jgi:hypothetical protein
LATPLRDENSSYRLRLIPLLSEFPRQFPEPSVNTARLDVLEPFSVHTGRTLIGFAAGIGVLQYVGSEQLVVQSIKPKTRVLLRFGMERRL